MEIGKSNSEDVILKTERIKNTGLPYITVWEACFMFKKMKKFLSIVTIMVLLPYIVTIFANGKSVDRNHEVNKEDALLKDHCIGLLAKEVSSDYEEEMLKVQALLVRTTVYKQVEELGEEILKQESFGNVEDIDPSWYKKLEKIWDETEGEVIMYQDKLALVPFHQVSNGKTRIGLEALGSEEYPYLQMKECPKDVEANNQMKSTFIEVKGVKVESYDSAGYALSVTIGEEKINGESFRNTYGLASSCFEFQTFENNTRVITKGVGHGLGLSQYTANEMAKEGKSYQEILQFFFTGTEIREVAEILWNIE